MNNKNLKLAAVALTLLGTIAAASATSFSTSTVGVLNPNNHTILESTGNSLTESAFASSLTTAFANNTGGVWNFDNPGGMGTVNVGNTITLSYGVSQSSSLVMTLGGQDINTGFNTTSEATSSSQQMGLSADASTRTFTLNTSLLNIGVFVGNRGDSSRTTVLSVTYLDHTTASTSGANGGPTAGSNYFEDLAGTALNPIVSFSLAQSNFVRYDDLAFIVAPVPEPGTISLAIAGGLSLSFMIARRRKA